MISDPNVASQEMNKATMLYTSASIASANYGDTVLKTVGGTIGFGGN